MLPNGLRQGLSSGNADSVKPTRSQASGSQQPRSRSNSSVRLALLRSVA